MRINSVCSTYYKVDYSNHNRCGKTTQVTSQPNFCGNGTIAKIIGGTLGGGSAAIVAGALLCPWAAIPAAIIGVAAGVSAGEPQTDGGPNDIDPNEYKGL